MKQFLLMIVVVMGQSVLGADKKPLTKEKSAKVIEAAIRKSLKKPTGELTKADLEKVRRLALGGYGFDLTDVTGLEKLTQLTFLDLYGNQLTNVKGLEKLMQLTSLDLRKNKLTSVKGLEKLTKLKKLYLSNIKLTDVKGLEKLTQLTFLNLSKNPALTKTQIAELQKALPKCDILQIKPPVLSPILVSLNEAIVLALVKDPNYIDMKTLRIETSDEVGCFIEFYNSPDRPLFNKGKITLSKYGKFLFQIIALTLAKHESQKSTVVEIAGHASKSSKTGLESTNADFLSKGWAFTVRDFLVEKGVKKERFGKVAGYGNRQPLKNKKNSDFYNNRISILVRLKGK